MTNHKKTTIKKAQNKHQNKTAKRITKSGKKSNLEKTETKPKKSLKAKSELVKLFIETLTSIKLYHWRTHSYAEHKATDDLYSQLDGKVDEFVEIMQGKMFSPNRIEEINDVIRMATPSKKNDLLERMLKFNEHMQNLDIIFDKKKDSDLLNLRDEIMGIVNRFIYLYSFDKI